MIQLGWLAFCELETSPERVATPTDLEIATAR